MYKTFTSVVLVWLAATQAQAEAVPFGNLNVDYRTSAINGIDRSWFDDQGSRFGVRWAEYLDDHFEARYIIEAESALAADDALIGELRQAWFGIRGSFGEVRAGRHLGPTRVALDPVDMFTDQAADQNTVLESEVEHDKSLAYINRFSGIGYALVLSADEDNRFSQDVMFNYNTEHLYLAASYLRGSDARNTLRLGASYRLPAGHQLGFGFEHLDDTQGNKGHDAYVLSAGYQLGNTLFKGQLGRNEAEAGGYAETLLGIGVDYQWQPSAVIRAQYSENEHRDHSAGDRERVFSLGLSFEF